MTCLKICIDFVRATEGRVNFRVAGLRDGIIDKLVFAHLESFVASFELRNHKLTRNRRQKSEISASDSSSPTGWRPCNLNLEMRVDVGLVRFMQPHRRVHRHPRCPLSFLLSQLQPGFNMKSYQYWSCFSTRLQGM